MVIVHILTY